VLPWGELRRCSYYQRGGVGLLTSMERRRCRWREGVERLRRGGYYCLRACVSGCAGSVWPSGGVCAPLVEECVLLWWRSVCSSGGGACAPLVEERVLLCWRSVCSSGGGGCAPLEEEGTARAPLLVCRGACTWSMACVSRDVCEREGRGGGGGTC
jgi:hypothetical protein